MNLQTDDCVSLLAAVTTPAELRALPAACLQALVDELRADLIRRVSGSGGHLAAGLGVVELTVALHRVLATPQDRLVWDVGHQSYPHKMLTGRRMRMPTLRKQGGLSGFPCRAESSYDAFGVAHAGTSVSAALGMALAAALDGSGRKSVAVIGDGALTAGMVYEALNQLGAVQADVLIVLNDNQMSISPSVGALTAAGAPARLCAALGLDYYGPVDGHDVQALIESLHTLLPLTQPRLLHVRTCKGKGYAPAEADPVGYHGVTAFDPGQGLPPTLAQGTPTYTEVFGDWLCATAAQEPRLVAITPAMREGSGLGTFAARYPARYHDTGIAEQHAVTLAAGLACEGCKPVVAIYSTFLQRAYDQLIHDVALQNLPVLFALDRGGLVGADGATHHGSFDLSFLRCIPNLVIMTPADGNECRQLLTTGFQHTGPAAVRYPRGSAGPVSAAPLGEPLPLGQAQLRRQGKKIALLAFGPLLDTALAAAEQLDASVVNMRFVKPLDADRVQQMASTHELLVTLEDNVISGGAGSAVNECLHARHLSTPTLNLGLPDTFVEHGSREQLLAACGLDCAGVLSAVARYWQRLLPLRRRA